MYFEKPSLSDSVNNFGINDLFYYNRELLQHLGLCSKKYILKKAVRSTDDVVKKYKMEYRYTIDFSILASQLDLILKFVPLGRKDPHLKPVEIPCLDEWAKSKEHTDEDTFVLGLKAIANRIMYVIFTTAELSHPLFVTTTSSQLATLIISQYPTLSLCWDKIKQIDRSSIITLMLNVS